jgi:hypothetical protein
MDTGAPSPKEYRDIPGWVTYDERQKLEISNDLGILDKNELAVFLAIAEYSDKYKTSYLPLQDFYKYLYEYGLRTNTNALKVEDNIVSLLRKVYYYLHKKNYCRSDVRENKITGLILLDPQILKPEEVQAIIKRLKNEYVEIKRDYDKPFIMGNYIPKSGLSSKVLAVVTIRELTQQKIIELSKGAPIIKILFPSNNDILILSDDLPFLMDIAFDKLKKHLSKNRDLGMLVLSKLKQQFQSLAAVSKMDTILMEANFDPKLWASLATEIINLSLSGEKWSSLYQSGEIVKYLSIIRSDDLQKRSHSDKSSEILMKILESYPAPFTKRQVLQLREKHAYFKLHSERDYIDIVNQFLQANTVSDSIEVPPRFLKIKIGEEQKYIHRSHFLPNFFDKLDSIAYDLKKELKDRMELEKEVFLKEPIMRNPDLFDKYISDFFHRKDPMIVQIVEDPDILYSLLTFYGSNNAAIKGQIERFFYSPTRDNEVPHRKGLDDILLISWEKTLSDAKKQIPLIYRIPILGFLMKLLTGFGRYMDMAVGHQLDERKKQPKLSQLLVPPKKEKQKKVAEKKPAGGIHLQKGKVQDKILKGQMLTLQQRLIGNKNIDEMLDYFESKWNHTINPEARKENINMVKTKIQHRLSFIKNVSADIIKRETTDMMKTEAAFKKVADTDSLKTYIALYMIKYYLK